jgi:hypothetical protein
MAKKSLPDVQAKRAARAEKPRRKGEPSSKKKPSTNGRTAKAPQSQVRVRMYRQGLGDCFLLSFPKPKGANGRFFILIDCGVILGTPSADKLMKAVVDDIAETTGKHIDILIATHEHWDHVSGFEPGAKRFNDFQIDKVWLAWTEDPANALAQQLRRERAHKLAALWMGFGPLQERLRGMLPAAAPGATPDPQRKELEETAASVERAAQVLSFFGIDPDKDAPPQQGGLGAAAAAAVSKTGAAMTWVREVTKAPRFCKPGDLIEIEEASGVRVYVLGPPTDLQQLRKTLPTHSGHETYGLSGLEPAQAEQAFFAAGSVELEATFDPSQPFDPQYRVERKEARVTDFFRDHYFGSGTSDDEAWRRIEGDWTGAAARFALQLDSDTNNTSLALAFELPDGRVLLFPGDAQVGNWESWHVDPDGKTRVWAVNGHETTAEQLLNRTVLYKVGHHGSHNATLREKGLEMMTDKNLAALVPVDVFVAHDKKGWTKMPFNPLMNRLEELTRGRIVQADRALLLARGVKPGQPAPWSKNPTEFTTSVRDATKTIDVVINGKGKTEERPLYVEYTL